VIAVQRLFLEVSRPRQPRVLLVVLLLLEVPRPRVVWLERWLVRLRLGRVRFLILVSIFFLFSRCSVEDL
jgi:hypothetical protein